MHLTFLKITFKRSESTIIPDAGKIKAEQSASDSIKGYQHQT